MDEKPDVSQRKLNERQAAEYLGLAWRTMQGLRLRRQGPAYLKIGGRVRYLVSDLDAYLASCRVVPERREQLTGAHAE